eukprot:SAG31_NODE_7376_length_1704_cov_4.759290_1_plen_94_part_10
MKNLFLFWLLQYAKEEGDIDSLFYPLDADGTACGVGEMAAYKSLYYPFPMDPEINTCITSCPEPGTPPLEDVTAPFNTYICTADTELKHGGKAN